MRQPRLVLMLGIATLLFMVVVPSASSVPRPMPVVGQPLPTSTWPTGIPSAVWAPYRDENVGRLYGIAGVAPDDVWTVGRTAREPHQALIAHWDGTRWSVSERLSIIPKNHVLKDVVALAKDDVWAVGSYETGGEPPNVAMTPLLLHWNGLIWEQVRVHVEGITSAYLSAIGVTKEGTLWAVGSVIFRKSGSSWEQIPTPVGENGFPETYNDVAAISDDNVWVLGSRTIRRWVGTGWEQALDGHGVGASDLTAMEVISDSDVWVAGQYHYSGGMTHTYFQLLHWDGVKWEDVARPPKPGSGATSRLAAIHCSPVLPCYLTEFAASSANDIWLVGDAGHYPLVSHWDGARWQSDPCPTHEPPGKWGIMRGMGGAGALYDVAILAPDKIWAVGSRTFTEGNRFVDYGYVHSVLHGPCPTPEPTATRPPPPTIDTRPRATLPPPPQTVYVPPQETVPAPVPSSVPTSGIGTAP